MNLIETANHHAREASYWHKAGHVIRDAGDAVPDRRAGCEAAEIMCQSLASKHAAVARTLRRYFLKWGTKP